MTKHTPGPWTQDDSHGRRFIERVGTGDTVAIACKVDGKDGWKEMNANANLIAAAPDLLRLLAWALPEVESRLRQELSDGGVGMAEDFDRLYEAQGLIRRLGEP